LWRAFATRIVRAGWPSCIVTVAFSAKTKRARGPRSSRKRAGPRKVYIAGGYEDVIVDREDGDSIGEDEADA
jgi:hypothetical protein